MPRWALLQVKAGQLDYKKAVAPVLEALMDEVERLVNESNLPEKVDIDYWNHFLCETLDRYINNKIATLQEQIPKNPPGPGLALFDDLFRETISELDF